MFLFFLLFPPVFCFENENGLKNLPPDILKYKNGSDLCFGFEPSCQKNSSISREFQVPKCDPKINGRVKHQFYNQADFGYLVSRRVKNRICSSAEDQGKSSLECSDNLQHCWARNIFMDFKNLKIKTSTRYRENVIQPGEIGGNCQFYNDTLLQQHTISGGGYLTNWVDEFRHFQHFPNFEVSSEFCDVIFEKPTILMKLDAAVNMYHHFCDFINLYASMHLNGSFDQDIDIIWFETHPEGYMDQLYGITWKAFSKNNPIELKTLDQKKVCFKNLLLPLLARQREGLFYNTPLVAGCSGSAMVSTFSNFILHRLGIQESVPDLENVRVTILSRSTAYRRILNVVELLRAVGQLPNVTVKVVDYNSKISFLNQLNTTSKSDIFIGMHGAGLTHLLFLPDWAAIFEIYNCGDELCYWDLARLRGVKYFTWLKEKTHLIHAENEGKHTQNGQKHKKFANYSVDVGEFVSVVKKMVEYVRRHPKFVEARRVERRRRRAVQQKFEL